VPAVTPLGIEDARRYACPVRRVIRQPQPIVINLSLAGSVDRFID
jgi:hypothetical protein